MAVLDRMEAVDAGAGERPKEPISITHATVFVNPYQEVEEGAKEEERAAEQRREEEELARRRAAESRKRAAAAVAAAEAEEEGAGAEAGVGKYLQGAIRRGTSAATQAPAAAEVEIGAPRAKRARGARTGFGNFDGW